LPILLLVIGGLLGLDCPGRRGDLVDRVILGECDDMDVGVEIRLSAPGDSERRVDELLECGKLGVGCGRLCVDIEWDVNSGRKLAMRELDVAWSQYIVGFLGKCDVDEEIAGNARPSTAPVSDSLNPPGLLAVAYRLPGSSDETDDWVRAYCACWSFDDGFRRNTCP
jgi:hypothetical protein